MRLSDLDADVLAVLFTHVEECPLALKLACRALRAAGPAKTETSLSEVVASVARLRWARALGYAWGPRTCRQAALAGHLAVLQWARAQDPPCPWDEGTCAKAAKYGHLEVLQWLRANGCPWNDWVCMSAAENDHLEVLKWAYEYGCPAPEPGRSDAFDRLCRTLPPRRHELSNL